MEPSPKPKFFSSISKGRLLTYVCLSFSAGILLASAFFISTMAVYIILAAGAAGAAIFFVSDKVIWALICLAIFLAGLGMWRMNLSIKPNSFAPLFGQVQSWEGYVVEDPSIRANNQLLSFKPEGYSQLIRINTNLNQKFFYGDKIMVSGTLTEPENFNDFDYQGYLERYNTYGLINYPKRILILESHRLNPLKGFLLRLKYSFIDRLAPLYGEPQRSLLFGMLLGGHGLMPKDIAQNFNNTGTSHIIAVSGFNITIIASVLAWLAYVFGRRASFYFAAAAIFSFVLITGASASAIRAGIMGILVLYSFKIGRQYSILPALFFAALVMEIINPKILFWDLGFQLSFLATLGIIFFLPLFNGLAQNWAVPKNLTSLIFTTLSATLATLPVILFNFGVLSTTSLAVNTLVLPAVPLTMLFGFLSAIPVLGPGFAFIANGLLGYTLKIVGFFGRVPFGAIDLKISGLGFWLLSAAILGTYFLLKYQAKKISQTGA